MIPFSRRARWLQEIFTPSVAPARPSFPDRYSNDVSLIQDYLGGGWGFQEVAAWNLPTVASTSGASGIDVLHTVAEDEIFRIFSIYALLSAAADPSYVAGQFRAGTTGNYGALTEHVTGLIAGERTLLRPLVPVIPPGGVVYGRYSGGDVNTIVTWGILGTSLPLGAAPWL